MHSRGLSTLLVAIVSLTILACLGEPRPGSAQEPPPARKRKVEKSDAEWAKLLTREQFLVTRRKATEPPFTGKFASHHAKGTYQCVCCGADLFSSRTKFESGTGWPSFYQPVDRRQIETAPDFSMPGEDRVEVNCIDCGAHLGHVFNDGPPPTGLRFCINSASLKFRPLTVTGKGTETAKSKAKAKGKTKGRTKSAPGGSETAPPDTSKGEKPEPPKDAPSTAR